MDLSGKVVVVTGAAQGMGAAYARAVAAHGGQVVVSDVDADGAARVAAEISSERPGTAVAHVADVADWAAAEGLVDTCVGSFGRIDGLVNNAGLYDVRRSEETDEATTRLLVDVNVNGTIFCGVHAMRRMLAQGSGSIVNVTSGALAGLPLRSVYSATKAAVAALTYSWAQDLRKTPVRVNAISPLGKTQQLDIAAGYLGVDRDTLLGDVPPEANAPAVVYLLSDAAADIRGQVVRVSDRFVTLITRPDVIEPQHVLPDRSPEAMERAFDEFVRPHLQGYAAPDWWPKTAADRPGAVSESR